MKNFIQHGAVVAVVAGADVSSGDLVVSDAIVGVAQADALTGEDVQLVRTGVFTLPKVSAQAWTVGAKIYWTGTECTTTASTNKLIGAAMAVAANPSATGVVLLDGAAR